MKITLKLLRYCAIAAGLGAAVLTARATPVTGWGTETGFQNGSAVTSEDGLGGFVLGGANITGNDVPRAVFPTTTLGIGQTLNFSGLFTFTAGSIGNQQLRFGIFNSNGQNTGSLSGGMWTGATPTGWLGYMFEPGTAGADNLVERNNPNTGNFFSGTGATSLLSTPNAQNALPGTYSFDLSLSLVSASQLDIFYSFTQTSGGSYATSGTFSDTTPSVTSFNAVGFLLNASVGSGTTPFTFNNVDVSLIPEPTSAAFGLVGLMVLRFASRRRNA